MLGSTFCRPALFVYFAALLVAPVFSQTVTISPTSLSFGNQVQGTPSAASSVTLKNKQSSAITITSISTNLSDYVATSACPTNLAKGASCTISIIFTPSVLGTRSGTLSVVDNATSSPQKVTLSGTGTAPSLISIAVTPSSASVAAGLKQQFTATGVYSNGTQQNLTSTATWSSSKTSVATVNTAGLATAVAPGSTTITAKSGTISGSATIAVTAAVLTSIAVTPTTASVAAGITQQLTATGTFSNGTTQNLSSTASWSSSAPSIATVNSSGLATGITPGSATLTASSGTISGSALLTVTAAALKSIAVSPATVSVAAGNKQQFTATGTYTNGTTQNLTSTTTWTSSNPAITTVNNAGLATAVAPGSATITATSGTISGSASLTITAAALTSIAVTPTSASVAAGFTQQFTATGTYSDGTTQNLTTSATWTSSSIATATIPAHTGLATAVATGVTTITATSGTIQGSAALTVTPAVLTSIAVTPGSASVAAGYKQQFTATGTYSNGTTQNLTATASWTSSSPSIATVSAGLATSVAQGSANITVTSGTILGSATLTVTTPALVNLAVSPTTASIAKGKSQQFTATGTYSDGSTQDLSTAVSWSSSPITVATIASGGVASGVAVGTAVVTATWGSATASATLVVGEAVLVSLAVTPANPSFALGTTLPLIATGTYSDGSTLVLTTGLAWSTTDSGIATVDGQGTATSVAVGSTSVSATSNGITGSTNLTISPAVLVSIVVTPAIPTLPLGKTQAFTATGTYTNGSTQDITATVDWSTNAPAVMTISTGAPTPGIGSSVAEGTATVRATSGSVTGSTTATVTSAALVSLAISPAAPSIALGTMQQFTATGTFTDGSRQDLTSASTWTSDTTTIATINNAGLAQSTGVGTSAIAATSGSVTGSTQLTVTPATLASITINPPQAAVPLGAPQQFTATGTFTDGTTQDLTQSGHWSSTVAGVATISNTGATAGLASTLATGATTIGVSSGGVNQSASLTVNPAMLASIAITPADSSIALGTTQQFVATGTYTDGTTQDVTTTATWNSSSSAVAIISNAVGSSGLATSSGQGTATITATSGSVSSSTSLTVGHANLSSIAVTPASISIALGYGEQFAATATYSDGSTQDITQSATWTSSALSTASVNSSGYASSLTPGIATISATSGSVSGGAVLTVAAAVPVSLAINPPSSSVFIGVQQQFSATLTYSDGSFVNVTNSVLWSSSNPGVATVDVGSGLALGVGGGTSAIAATWGSNLLTASASMVVSPPTVAITPPAASIAISGTQQFSATVSGSTNQSVTWSVDGVLGGSPTLGTISAGGLYSASPFIGTHSITATALAYSASQGTAALNVGSSIPIPETFFGMHLHLLTSPVPSSMVGTGRIWDSAAAQWPNLNTASNTFVWTSLDSVLANYKTAGINDVMYTLWRVPTWASSNKTDTACDYSALGPSFYGACDLPVDINADGTGTDLIWRTWVQNIAQHVNSPGYLDTHARIAYWEPCNECFRSPTLTPGYTSGSGALVAYRGTYAQLVRLMQDARCIIIGHPDDPITALNTTCGQAGYPMIGIDPTSQMIMPSAGTGRQSGQTPPYVQASQNLLYCTCTNNSCSASTTGCTTGSAGSAAVDVLSMHVYPKTFSSEQIPTQVATVRAYFSATDLAKPFWNGEGSWGQNASSTYINNGDPDLEVAFVARYQIMTWASGLTRSYWYQWDNSASGTLWNSTANSSCSTPYATGYVCKAGIAYQQVHDWLVGSTLGACSATGTIWTCTLTQASGGQAAIMWDTSQTCSSGSCTTTQRPVSSIYFHYIDLTGASFPVSGTAPVGIKPILLQQP